VEKEKRIGDLLFSKSEGCKSWIVVVGVWREGGGRESKVMFLCRGNENE
jgi:hypothetical protein